MYYISIINMTWPCNSGWLPWIPQCHKILDPPNMTVPELPTSIIVPQKTQNQSNCFATMTLKSRFTWCHLLNLWFASFFCTLVHDAVNYIRSWNRISEALSTPTPSQRSPGNPMEELPESESCASAPTGGHGNEDFIKFRTSWVPHLCGGLFVHSFTWMSSFLEILANHLVLRSKRHAWIVCKLPV